MEAARQQHGTRITMQQLNEAKARTCLHLGAVGGLPLGAFEALKQV